MDIGWQRQNNHTINHLLTFDNFDFLFWYQLRVFGCCSPLCLVCYCLCPLLDLLCPRELARQETFFFFFLIIFFFFTNFHNQIFACISFHVHTTGDLELRYEIIWKHHFTSLNYNGPLFASITYVPGWSVSHISSVQYTYSTKWLQSNQHVVSFFGGCFI